MASKRPVVRAAFLPREPIFTPLEALTLAHQRAKASITSCAHFASIEGMCAHVAACNYGFASCGFVDAISMWHGLPDKYRRHGLDRMLEAPAGALLFWSGGSAGHGHVGLANGKGKVLATDRPVAGHFGRTPIEDIQSAWGLTPVGWAFPFFELAGSDSRRPPEVAHQERKTPHVNRIIECQQDSIAAAKRAIQARKHPDDDRLLHKLVATSRDQIDLARSLHSS